MAPSTKTLVVTLAAAIAVMKIPTVNGSNLRSLSSVCSTIENSWWKQREDYKNQWPYTDPGAQEYCAQWDGDVDGCRNSAQDMDNALVMCTIEGGGHNSKCVPTNCAHLNQGMCHFNFTGGLCQWFEHYETPDGKTLSHGCYANPCNLGGLSTNDESYCQGEDLSSWTLKLNPPVQCKWCGSDKIGCQNSDPFPLTGCAEIGSEYVNNNAKNAAKNCLPEGNILTMSKSNPLYKTNTPCANKDLVQVTDRSPVQCIEGQVGCSIDNGFEYKYKPNCP